MQSGKPVGIFRTHPEAPRVLMANSNLVGHWSNWDEFNRLEKLGLTMYGQMTAGSWIYIGSQGIVQGTYETFASLARKHFGGSLAGKLVVSGGMGGMGGAQPLAATMNGACFLGVDVDPPRIQRRIETGYCDRIVRTPGRSLALARCPAGPEAISVGLVGNCADVLPELARRGIVPDVLTDQTSAHDPLNGYVPNGMTAGRGARAARARSPGVPGAQSMAAMGAHVEAMLASAAAGRGHLRLRQQHPHPGEEGRRGECLRHSRLRAGVHSAALLRRPRSVPLGRALRRPRGYLPHRPAGRWSSSRTTRRWRDGCRWPGSAFSSRGCRRASAGWATASARSSAWPSTALVRSGELKAPIVIGRDHLDAGSVASPYRETEGMRDGSDAIADWPLLNALVNTAAGASWVSIHNGGGVGIGYSQHAGMVVVADGTGERAAPGARADHRSRHGRDPARGRRLRSGHPVRQRPRDQAAGVDDRRVLFQRRVVFPVPDNRSEPNCRNSSGRRIVFLNR